MLYREVARRCGFQVEGVGLPGHFVVRVTDDWGHTFVDPFHGTVFSHGSFIYLLDGDGAVLTLLPPVLGPEMMAQIISGYLGAG